MGTAGKCLLWEVPSETNPNMVCDSKNMVKITARYEESRLGLYLGKRILEFDLRGRMWRVPKVVLR